MDFVPDKTTAAYSRIKSALLRNTTPAGTFLNIKTIAQTMRVSPTPVREALIRLSDEDLVGFAPNRGYFVRHLGPDDIRADYEIAFLIVKYSIEKALDTLSETPISAAKDSASRRLPSLSRTDVEDTAAYVEGLYHRIALLSGNRKLVRAMDVFNERTGYLRRFGLLQGEEFSPILSGFKSLDAAVGARDRGKALTVLAQQHSVKEQFINRLLKRFEESLPSEPQSFEKMLT